VVPDCDESFEIGNLMEISSLYSAIAAQETQAASLFLFLPLDVRALKVTYSW
jgi:hypothetical protein